ncbi:MAG TPA: ABC transporter permease, partial [Cyclobacteriaceae bacterium]|nr:ABC transporter permease [Cyclobacteriaceae bacterium]
LCAQENRGDTELLRSQLISTGVVQDIAESNYPVTSTLGWNDNFQWKTKTDDIEGLSFNTVFVTHSYGNTMGLEFVSGRDFTDDIQSDLQGVIINETAANDLGGEDLIGETLIWDHWGQRMEYTILGIFKDMVKGSPFAKTDPIMLFMSARPLEFLYVRLNDDVDPRSALPKVEKAFKAVVPEVPFDYSFADQDYDFKFKEEERIGKLAAVFSSFAIFISCLGVLGLVSYVAEKRSKEISIRKVLGATTSQVWQMISKDFLLLVLISCGVALPLSYILMNQWLERYYYRTDIPWYLLIGSGICILIVTLITVSFQSIKAGTANPVDNLRSE